MINKTIRIVVVFLLITFLHNTRLVIASDDISDWTLTNGLFTPMASQGSFVNMGVIYAISGANNSVIPSTTFSSILSGGGLNPWSHSVYSSPPLYWHTAVNYNEKVYLLGGSTILSGSQDSVFLGLILSNGSIENWSLISQLPKRLSQGAGAVWQDKIYFAGGFTDNQGNASANVYVSTINPDGTISPWQDTTPLPSPRYGFELLENNGYLYVVGINGSNNVYVSQINSDGTLGSWSETAPLPQVANRASVAKAGDSIYVIGGNPVPDNKVFISSFNADGSLTPWTEGSTNFPRNQCCSPAVEAGGRIYVLGGHDGSYYSDVWMTNKLFEPSPFPTPSPTAAPSPTPSPTTMPTPTQIPIPVTKIVVVPGMGASWNSDALVNCKDTGYSGDWTLAPFAREAYEALWQNLDNNYELIEFYYDWRKDVRMNGERLHDLLSARLSSGEKAYLFGHSMGGLVGRAYLESDNARIEKYLSAGTPHLGAVLAYPAWSAGELWEGDLIMNIGKTIAFRRCGITGRDREIVEQHFPSFQNVLPIFDFLRDKQTQILKPVASMHDRNNWLPTDFLLNSTGVTVGTLSGTGKKTLSEIVVKNPSKRDVQLGNWEDGKPDSRKHIVDGDGAVLLLSSQIQGSQNWVIAGTHNGILSNPLGIETILNFYSENIQLSRVARTASSDPESALVVIGEADFAIVNGDQSAKGDGVVTILNPKKGKFKLNFKPVKGKTKLSIAQFLPGGKVVWKDYDFVGLGTRSRLIEYDPQTPIENPLR